MGVYAEFDCPECGFQVRLGGPEEFYWDASGRRRHYGHPSPSSPEARAAGISGFFTHMWCPECQEVKHVVVAEFDQPAPYLRAWDRLAGMAEPTEPIVCPDCSQELGCCIWAGCPTCSSDLKTSIVKT